MRRISVLVVIMLLSFVNRGHAMSQITLQNNTSFWLNLFIDSNFGCGPVMPSGFCTSSVTPGDHLLTARRGSEPGSSLTSEMVKIEDGASPTWTVNYEDPNKVLLKKIDGARYVNQFSSKWMAGEDELVIKGTTLIWRNRLTWASPEIEQAIKSGTGGFRHQSIGSWLEFGQMQIVGREAQHRRPLSNGSVEEVTFTISEDGNNITKKEGSKILMFYRQ